MKKFLSILVVFVITISILPISHVSAYVTGTVGQYNTISAGGKHSMAIKTDGTLWAWGCCSDGRLGNDMRYNGRASMGDAIQSVPDKIMDDVVSVSAGGGFTMAVKADHTLWAWGQNTLYDLGNNGVSNKNNSDIYGSQYHYQTVPIKIMDDVETVSAGFNHTMVIKTDGSLWAWGHNDYGQLGNNKAGNFSDEGHMIQTTPIKIMDNVASVNTGYAITMIIKTDGTLWACGNNTYGQLGNGGTKNQTTPVKIMSKVASVTTGGNHTMAIKTDGSLWAWGSNFYNQLGNGKGGFTLKKNEDGGFYERIAICQKSPVKIMDNVVSVSASDRFTMAIKTDGALWAWGWNSYGQIGNNGKGNTYIDDIPIQKKPVRILYNAALVSTGSDYAMAVKTDGTLWAWGVNDYGQLGFDRTSDSSKWGDPYQSVPKEIMKAVATNKAVAKPSASAVLVNRREISFDAYTISGSSYFKLRDLAAVLNGTSKQFDVTWDSTNKAINLILGKPYTTAGGELTAGDGKSKIALLNKSKIYIDGIWVTLRSYIINGNSYFKLRDIAKALNIGIAWDGKTNTISIDTSKIYVD